MQHAGCLIALEGPDCSGTSRQSHMLTERLRQEGYDALCTAEPTNGTIGSAIRNMLHGIAAPQPDTIQLLFTADRAEHVSAEILPALERGAIVVTDRYALSTIVYGMAQELPEAWLRALNSQFPDPALTVITLPPFAVCMERMARRQKRDHYEEPILQRKVYDLYARAQDPQTVFVDTSGTKEATAQTIWEAVSPVLTTL